MSVIANEQSIRFLSQYTPSECGNLFISTW